MTALDERYGTTRSRRGWWIAGISLVVIAAFTWMIAVTFFPGRATLETDDVGRSYNADTRVMTVTWNVSVAAGTPISCAVQVLNEQFQVVGWKVVDLPAGTQYTRQFSTDVRSAMPPTAANVDSCWGR